MRLAVSCVIVAALLGGGGCDAHSSRAPAAAPARAPTAAPHASAARVVKAPQAVASSTLAPPARQAVATCVEPCQGCTVLTESDGKPLNSRRLTAAEQALLDDLFHNYLLSADCLADPEHLELRELRKSRQDVSDVKAVADGSFTAAGRNQTIVIFFMGHCGVLASHSEHYGLSVLVLMEAGKIVMVTEDGPTTAVELLPIDLENDGVTELVAVTGDYASGATFSEAEVWSVANAMTSLAHFDLSYRSCLGDEPEYFESTVFTRWDPETKRRCLLQRRRELRCPP